MSDEALQRAYRLHNSGNVPEAARIYDDVLRANPNNFHALYLYGALNLQRGAFADAEALLKRAVTVDPRSLDALYQLGHALEGAQRHAEALACFERLLQLYPTVIEAWTARGFIQLRVGSSAEALASFDRAVALNTNSAEAWYGRAVALSALRRLDEAIGDYGRCIALAPDRAAAWNGRADALYNLKRFDEAMQAYARAIELDPDSPFCIGHVVYWRLSCCDWRSFDEDRRAISAGLKAGKRVVQPGQLLALSESPEDQLNCARVWSSSQWPGAPENIRRGERYQHERIRLAYISADFCDHVVAAQIAGALEHHDKARFETIGISLEPHPEGEMRTRLRRAFDRFGEAETMNDLEVAALLRESEVDIAIDLMGFTMCCRPGILALRPAPVQVSFLGYPGTMGTDFIDYIVADPFVMPEPNQRFFAEKVAYMPRTYMPTDPTRRCDMRGPSRASEGLPEDGFVFCSFCNSFKFTPQMFDVWMRLLHKVEGSVLWLRAGNEVAMDNLRCEAKARGVDPGRLIFAPFIADARNHIRRLSLADLFLDTLPYNAHATASDALMAGVPVLTCAGEAFASRVGMSLLNAAGLSELVTSSLDDYEALGHRLACDSDTLAAFRKRLAFEDSTPGLFDVKQFTRDLEALYRRMWLLHQIGEPPQSFAVSDRGA